MDTFSLQNIHPHQVEFMRQFEKQGGIAFFLIFYSHKDLLYLSLIHISMMYYDYSTDGGKTYSELIPWPDLDIMAGTYPDTFTFSLSFTKGETPVITVRGYNQADLFTESEPITFAKPFVDQEKACLLYTSNSAYKTSGGLHGVGSSVVNALSTRLTVRVKTGGCIYEDRYERGNPVLDLVDGLLPIVGKTRETGTTINFLPDDTIFDKTRFKEEMCIRDSILPMRGYSFVTLKLASS